MKVKKMKVKKMKVNTIKANTMKVNTIKGNKIEVDTVKAKMFCYISKQYKYILLIMLLILALVWTHINILGLMMGDSKWVFYSVNQSIKQGRIDFVINLYEMNELDLDGMNIKDLNDIKDSKVSKDTTDNIGNENVLEDQHLVDIHGVFENQVLQLSLIKDNFEVMTITWHTINNTVVIDSPVSDQTEIDLSALNLSNFGISEVGTNDSVYDMKDFLSSLIEKMDVVTLDKHKVEDGIIMNEFLINDTLKMCIDYLGHIHSIEGPIDLKTNYYYVNMTINY